MGAKVTVTNLLQGPAVLYVGEPDDLEPQYTDTPIAPLVWRDLGGTDGGARMVTGQTYSNMVVDQIALPVGSRLVSQEVTVATSLAEATLENLALALNQEAPVGGEIELDSEISNAEPLYRKFLIVGQKPGGGPRLIVIRRCLSTANVEMAWTKDNKTMIPVTFFGYYVDEATKALRISDAVTPAP